MEEMMSAEEFQKASEEKFKNFNPETEIFTEDGSWRTVVIGKLGKSGRKFKMVELKEGQEWDGDKLKSEIDAISEILLEVERHPDDPKYKDEPVMDFTSDKYPPTTKKNFVKNLGKSEFKPLKVMLEYLIYISNKDEFFRTG